MVIQILKLKRCLRLIMAGNEVRVCAGRGGCASHPTRLASNVVLCAGRTHRGTRTSLCRLATQRFANLRCCRFAERKIVYRNRNKDMKNDIQCKYVSGNSAKLLLVAGHFVFARSVVGYYKFVCRNYFAVLRYADEIQSA